MLDVGTELSAATAAGLRAAVADKLRHGRTIHLQLGSVVSYDAVGMGLLVGLRRRIEAVGGHLLCVSPPPALYAGLQKLGFHRALEIRLDVPERTLGPPAARSGEGGR